MNEDDTFRHLTRIPYKELTEDPACGDEFFNGYIFRPFPDDEIVTLAKYGWTELEFKRAYRDELLNNELVKNVSWWPKFEDEIKRLEEIENGKTNT